MLSECLPRNSSSACETIAHPQHAHSNPGAGALCLLRDLPSKYNNRYSEQAANELIEGLFLFLSDFTPAYLTALFPEEPAPHTRWSLRKPRAQHQGQNILKVRGTSMWSHFQKRGGHYRCRSCSSDDTCVLCSRCFQASEHEGHNVFVTLSPGNSGCCDCGDPEAWLREVACSIHTVLPGNESKAAGKAKEGSSLPPAFVTSIHMTIARALDYLCDVFSCSPEQLRLPKTEESVRDDERQSRLPAKVYNTVEDKKRTRSLHWFFGTMRSTPSTMSGTRSLERAE